MERIETRNGPLAVGIADGKINRISFTVPAGTPKATSELALEAERQLEGYFAGERKQLELPVDERALSPFQRRMFKELARLAPKGKTVSYGQLASALGHRGSRAVGQALGANPLPIVFPCHRVLAANGKIGGFGGGTEWKERLLACEQAAPSNNTE